MSFHTVRVGLLASTSFLATAFVAQAGGQETNATIIVFASGVYSNPAPCSISMPTRPDRCAGTETGGQP
jgi:hypothetical protein